MPSYQNSGQVQSSKVCQDKAQEQQEVNMNEDKDSPRLAYKDAANDEKEIVFGSDAALRKYLQAQKEILLESKGEQELSGGVQSPIILDSDQGKMLNKQNTVA